MEMYLYNSTIWLVFGMENFPEEVILKLKSQGWILIE
jgi:hypothetical protein